MTLLFENRIYLLASIFHEDNDRGFAIEHLLPDFYANKDFLGNQTLLCCDRICFVWFMILLRILACIWICLSRFDSFCFNWLISGQHVDSAVSSRVLVELLTGDAAQILLVLITSRQEHFECRAQVLLFDLRDLHFYKFIYLSRPRVLRKRNATLVAQLGLHPLSKLIREWEFVWALVKDKDTLLHVV